MNTPSLLNFYVAQENVPVVKFLLKHGADPNAVVIRGQTLLSWAVHDENLETVKLLLDAGANPDAEVEPEGAPGETIPAIVFAADRGNRALFLLLKEKGAKLPDLVPVPVVKIPGKSYAFGKYEVTQAQYASVMGANPSNFKGDGASVVERRRKVLRKADGVGTRAGTHFGKSGIPLAYV